MNGHKKIAGFFLFCSLVSCDWQVPRNNDGIIADASHDSILRTHESVAQAKNSTVKTKDSIPPVIDSLPADNLKNSNTRILPPSQTVDIKGVAPNDVVTFAESLMGTPYVYASTDPKVGFDCSGFITYVFNHFGIRVPRSSVDFTNVGKTIPVEGAKRGDLILFTGTNPQERHVGHMGIVVSNSDTLRFIHSSSGKAMGVTVTPLNEYYKSRFVRVSRIFPQNDTAP